MGECDSSMASMALKAWWRFWVCTRQRDRFYRSSGIAAAAEFILRPRCLTTPKANPIDSNSLEGGLFFLDPVVRCGEWTGAALSALPPTSPPPSAAEIHCLWGVLHPAREARARLDSTSAHRGELHVCDCEGVTV